MKATADVRRLRPAHHAVAATIALSATRRHLVNLALLSLGVALVGIPLFYGGLFGNLITDHFAHVQFVERGLAQGVWPAHFLFQAVVFCLSGFSHEFASLAWASLVLLTVLVIAKTALSYAILVRRCPPVPSTEAFERRLGISHLTLLTAIAAALMLSAPVVRPWWTSRIYLGQISPNVWHNPTCILCWPLVILLFVAADTALRSPSRRAFLTVGALSALSVLAKPNYFLAFAPAYTLFALRRYGLSRTWLWSQLALVPTVALLGWQFIASFHGHDAMRPGLHLAWMPLSAWRVWAHSITSSLAFSLAFPLSYLVVYRRALRGRRTLWFAWAVMLSALVWMSAFAEVSDADGSVDPDFNFSWGAHLSLFVLFLVTAVDLLNNSGALARTEPKRDWSLAGLPWWILGAHAATGVLWITRQVIGKGFG